MTSKLSGSPDSSFCSNLAKCCSIVTENDYLCRNKIFIMGANNITKDASRIFTREQIDSLLGSAIGKTLLEVDKLALFEFHKGRNKVTGIAGDIIELSVLGCKRDSYQDADILVDGVPVEIKTTGMVKTKKSESPCEYECKEPVSITAVSIPIIVNEEFETSNFWHKLSHMLWVYYWYKSNVTVKLEGYKNFPVLGYQFYEFEESEKRQLKQDWLVVKNFLVIIHTTYRTESERKAEYPRLSSELRGQLMLIDTAPKYPNPPRFRLKRAFATVIAEKYFMGKRLEKLKSPITEYAEIDRKCAELTRLYKGKSFYDISQELGITVSSRAGNNKVSVKNFAELVVIKMFGSDAKSLNAIEDFAKIGLIAKSLPLTHTGKAKESMKLFLPDFDQWVSEETFEESHIREYFSGHQFLFIAYQYKQKNNKDINNIYFEGFKRIVISDDFINHDVRLCWTMVRELIKEKKLKIVQELRKDGTPIINPKSGTIKEAPNFPKEKNYSVFVRGGGGDSSEKQKTCIINGLRMLPQFVWLAKSATINLFKNR